MQIVSFHRINNSCTDLVRFETLGVMCNRKFLVSRQTCFILTQCLISIFVTFRLYFWPCLLIFPLKILHKNLKLPAHYIEYYHVSASSPQELVLKKTTRKSQFYSQVQFSSAVEGTRRRSLDKLHPRELWIPTNRSLVRNAAFFV